MAIWCMFLEILKLTFLFSKRLCNFLKRFNSNLAVVKTISFCHLMIYYSDTYEPQNGWNTIPGDLTDPLKWDLLPQKTNVTRKKGPCWKEVSSYNQHLLGASCLFSGWYVFKFERPAKTTIPALRVFNYIDWSEKITSASFRHMKHHTTKNIAEPQVVPFTNKKIVLLTWLFLG